MNRKELAKILSEKTGMSLKKSENLILAFGDVVSDALSIGEKIVYSNFGTFYTVHYPSKVIYHPVLGKEKKMVMLPTDAVKWMPSGNVKDMVAAEMKIDNAISYGSSKKLGSIRAEKGLTARKAIEIEPTNDFEIPIRYKQIKPPEQEPEKTLPPSEDIHTSSSKIILNPSTEEAAPSPYNPPAESAVQKKVDIPAEPSAFKKNSTFWDQLFHRAGQNDPSPASKNTTSALAQPSESKNQNKTPLVGTGIFSPKEDSVSKIQNIKNSLENAVQPPSPALPPETPALSTQKFSEPKDDLPSVPLASKKTVVSYADLSKIIVPKELLKKIPEKIAHEYKIVPIEDREDGFVVGMIDPEDIEAIELVKRSVQKKIIPKLVTESDISHVLEQYQAFESEVEKAIEDVAKDNKAEHKEIPDDLVETISDKAPAARIVSSLLRRAIRDKASDIHIEPGPNDVAVRFRVDGVLHKKVMLPRDILPAIVSRIKILSNLKIDEQRLPQDGRFSLKLDDHDVDFRVSTMPIANGEKVVMRVLDKVTGVIKIEELGFRERDFKVINDNASKAHGMILVTGPTGSGKTTTLYALIGKIYSEGINIVTLEDPIEYQIAGINQSQVNADIDYTFASGLRSILRQDPDVVMIGEIRDAETAEMAVHAALTGHIVLSTLHTNDSAGAVPRLIDMAIEPFLLNSSLNVVIGQRLARRICPNCREKVSLESNELKLVEDEIKRMPENIRPKGQLSFSKGKGCKECNDSGYKGRVGLYEVLEVSPKIRELANQRAAGSLIKETAMQEGMSTMIQDGILKAMEGVTTLEEIWRVTKE